MSVEKKGRFSDLDSRQKLDRILVLIGGTIGIVYGCIMLVLPKMLLWTLLPSAWGAFTILLFTFSIHFIICILNILIYGIFGWMFKVKRGSSIINFCIWLTSGLILLFFGNFAGIVFLILTSDI